MNIRSKVGYVRSLYTFEELHWEEKVRKNQLVSLLLSEAQAKYFLNKIQSSEPDENKKAYWVTPSSTKGKFRICVECNELKRIDIRSQQIIQFLNSVHRPQNKKWELIRDKICLLLSSHYNMDWPEVERSVYTFSKEAKAAGFTEEFIGKYTRYLIQELKKFQSAFYFEDAHFLTELAQLAFQDKFNKHKVRRDRVSHIAATMFAENKHYLPTPIAKIVGLFLTSQDASQLRQVKRSISI